MSIKGILVGLAAVAAIVAALLWLKSATVTVKCAEKTDKDGWTEAAIISDGADVIETAKRQSLWSKYAAYAASVSALTQAVSLLL